MEEEKGKYIPITIRFTKDAMETISTFATMNKMSKAEVVRYGFDRNLLNHLSKCIFVDTDDAKKVMSVLGDVLSEMQSIKGELRRIGINYNRALKIKEIERKIREKGWDVKATMPLFDEKKKLEEDEDPLEPGKLEMLMSRYEAATEKAGEALCHILG